MGTVQTHIARRAEIACALENLESRGTRLPHRAPGGTLHPPADARGRLLRRGRLEDEQHEKLEKAGFLRAMAAAKGEGKAGRRRLGGGRAGSRELATPALRVWE